MQKTNQTGQTRDKTNDFKRLRGEKKNLINLRSRSDDTQEIDGEEMENFIKNPEWNKYVEIVESLLRLIEKQLSKLDELYSDHLIPKFSIENENESEMDELNDQIKKNFNLVKNKIQLLGEIKVDIKDQTIRKNAKTKLLLDLGKITESYKKIQKQYMEKLISQEKVSNSQSKIALIIEEIENNNSNDNSNANSNYDSQLSEQEQLEITEAEKYASEREKEILRLYDSIKELSGIFKDLALMVDEQGTILDRIDWNVDNAQHYVDDGVIEINTAKKHQSSYRKNMCICCLCVAILLVILFMILYYTLDLNTVVGSNYNSNNNPTKQQ
jgi:syntaxin 16